MDRKILFYRLSNNNRIHIWVYNSLDNAYQDFSEWLKHGPNRTVQFFEDKSAKTPYIEIDSSITEEQFIKLVVEINQIKIENPIYEL
jgi:hypothetical protein